jgi:predicted dehydrogenase
MNHKKIGMGLIGPGFVGPHHIDAVRRLGDVDVVAVAGSSQVSAKRKAEQLNIARFYGDYLDLLADPEVEVVHNTTPSYMHLQVSMDAIRAGKHIISEKPLGLTPAECALLRDAANKAGVVNAVTFNYRGNPLIQQARKMVAQGDIGPFFFIHGHYLQDWMTDPNVYSWRSDPVKGGPSSALADIGSHWCDLAEHLSGSRISAVLADMTTVIKTRYSSGGSSEAFSNERPGLKIPIEVEGEDLASVLLQFENGAKGNLYVGQVLPGHKNGLQIELNGHLGSVRWIQEKQNELWIGRFDQPNSTMAKDPSLMNSAVSHYAHLPGGHQEGWSDAFFNVISDIYRWIRTGERSPMVCTFEDGYRISCIIDAMLRSHKAGGIWLPVDSKMEVADELPRTHRLAAI